MSLLKKTLSSFGIGTAKVEAVLQQEVLYPGQKVQVHLHLYGGAQEQVIEHLDVKLRCRYIAEAAVDTESDFVPLRQRVDETYTLAHWSLANALVIKPGETQLVEATLEVPWNTPVTIGDNKVWLDTELGHEQPLVKDQHSVTVRPDHLLDSIFSALESYGLRLRQVECEALDGFALPFGQEFELVPIYGPYQGALRELDIFAYRDKDAIQMWLDVDRPQRGHLSLLGDEVSQGQVTHHLTLHNGCDDSDAQQVVVEALERYEMEN